MNILVFTVSAWNSKLGSNTWAALLEGYDSACVANICIRNEQPDSPVCSRYFCISENKVIKSVFNRGIRTGKEVRVGVRSPDDEADLRTHNARYAKMAVERRYSMLLARELVWKFGRWKTPELNSFLDDFKPDVILHSMEGYIHLNRIVAYAIERTGAKAVGYIWDDNFTYKQSSDFGYKVYRFFQRRSLRMLAGLTDVFFSITPYTKKEADVFFGIKSIVLTKPMPPTARFVEPRYTQPIRMLYTGNARIGRLEVIKRIVEELSVLNKDGIRMTLDVYTNSPLTEMDKRQLNTAFSAVYSAISQDDVLQLQKQTDVLLFVESLQKDNQAARLSFSTKITDYYAAGKCIFAVGNQELAPMKIFLEADSAITAVNQRELGSALRALLEPSRLSEYARKAFAAGQENHSCEKIKKLFFSVIESTYSMESDSDSQKIISKEEKHPSV